MEQDRYYFRVGVFVAISIIAAVIVMFSFAGKHDDSNQKTYAIYFKGAVDGLTLGAPIKLKGIQIGTVKDIAFSSKEGDTIRVLADLTKTAPIHADTIASMQLQGITGTSVISLENSSVDGGPITQKDADDYPVINSKPSPLERVFTTVPELIDQMTKLARQGQEMLSPENTAALHDALLSISQSAQSLNKVMGGKNNQSLESAMVQLNELLAESKLTMRELRMLTRTVRDDPSIVLHGTQQSGVKIP